MSYSIFSRYLHVPAVSCLMAQFGGLPSKQSAIASSMAALIAIKEHIYHPAFGLVITYAFIVMLDPSSLRGLNKLASSLADHELLRERMGHAPIEIAA